MLGQDSRCVFHCVDKILLGEIGQMGPEQHHLNPAKVQGGHRVETGRDVADYVNVWGRHAESAVQTTTSGVLRCGDRLDGIDEV